MHKPLTFYMDEIPVPVVYAVHRIIRDCNAQFANLFGYERNEIVGGSFARLYPAIADFIRVGKVWSKHFAGAMIYYDERIMANAAGEKFWCQVNGRSYHQADPFAEALYCFQAMSRPVAQAQDRLTERQLQILTLVAQGKTSADIALELGLSKRTVETHRLRIARLTGARNTAELIAHFSR